LKFKEKFDDVSDAKRISAITETIKILSRKNKFDEAKSPESSKKGWCGEPFEAVTFSIESITLQNFLLKIRSYLNGLQILIAIN
jgi:hypothetical protein